MSGKKRWRTYADTDRLSEVMGHFLHTGGISGRGLSSLLKDLSSAPGTVDELAGRSRNAMTGACHADFDKIVVKEQLPLKDGTEFTWEYADPGLLLSLLVASSESHQQVFNSILEEGAMVARLRCVVGWDEFTPGSPSAHVHTL